MYPRPQTLLVVFALLALPVGPAGAQVVSIKTVPVATGDQFLVFPSQRLGMAGVSIALPDSVGDPFSNPSTIHRLQGPGLFAAPTAYGVTDGHGGAITLPVGAFFGGSRWRGGVGMAVQELRRGGEEWVGSAPTVQVVRDPALTVVPPSPNDLGQQSRGNLYGFAAASRSLGRDGRTAIGASAFVADLTGVSGVDLLYSSQTVDQRGSLRDVRLGMETGWGEQVLEAVVVHRRFAMEHDLLDWIWEPVPQEGVPEEQWPRQRRAARRTEQDETLTWGLQLNYVGPLEEDGWYVGGLLTANYKSHPKIPNYTLMSIPRDPGDSRAYHLGVGISKRSETSTFGIDLIYEPVWTETWADAAGPVPTTSGDTIPAGEMTVFNDFRFHNGIIRMGLEGRAERLDLQFGLLLKRYGYTLDQEDLVLERRRRQKEDWLEWTPSLALAFRFNDFTIGYTGRFTAGTGRPGVASGRAFPVMDATAASPDFLPAPSGSLTLDPAIVHTHQISVSIPFGG